MSRNIGRKFHQQATPHITALFMRFQFAQLKTRPREEERRREIVPKGVTCKIEPLQLVPRGRTDVAGEGRAWIAAILDHTTLAIRDPDSIRNEMPDRADARPG